MKFPLHLCYDAQGPMSIFDARGRAVMMLGSLFKPTHGYVFDENEARRVPDPEMGTTAYSQRCRLVREIFTFLTLGDKMSHQLDDFARQNGFDDWKDACHWISGADLGSKEKIAAFEAWKLVDGSKAGIMKLPRRQKEGGTPGAAST